MSDEPYCRPVEVDGVTALVRSAGEMTDHDRDVLTAALAELRRREGPGDTEADRAAAEQRAGRIAEMRRRARRRVDAAGQDVCPTCGHRTVLHPDCEPTDRCPDCRTLCDCYPEETPDE